MKRIIAALLMGVVLVFSVPALASQETANPAASLTQTDAVLMNPEDTTSFPIIIHDELDLFTPGQETELAEQMKPVAQYGAVAVWTTQQPGQVDAKAMTYYSEHIGAQMEDSGVLFMIDMDQRQIYLFSRGQIGQQVTRSDAYAITTDISHFATQQDYAGCATEAFRRVHLLLDGQEVFSIMRLICSGLIGLAAGLMIAYGFIRKCSIQRPVKNGKRTSILNLACSGEIARAGAPVLVSSKTMVSSDDSDYDRSSYSSRRDSSYSSSRSSSYRSSRSSSNRSSRSSCGSGGGSSF